MLVEKLKEHRRLVVASFREAMEFKAFTDLAYVLATEFAQIPEKKGKFILGHSQYGGAAGMSDQEVNFSDLPNHFAAAKTKYFFSLVHQQQVALFESLFFDLIRILLLDKPVRLSKNKQVDYETVFCSENKEEIIWKLIDRELNEIKYKKVAEWFGYLRNIVGIPEIEAQQLEKLAEAKATRDILVHNSGIINQMYLSKSGGEARFEIGQEIDVSGDYTRDVWRLFVELLVTIIDSLIQKFDEKHA